MVQLGIRNVRLKASIPSKVKAIQAVGELLTESGNIEAGYVDSMIRREAQANTYLGNGIAIPHGQPKDRDLILKTGIAVVQIPAGVEWNPGEIVHLVVGIAAKSDEHLQILTNLTHVLDDAAAVQQLSHTGDPELIVERLTRVAGSPARGHGQGAGATADRTLISLLISPLRAVRGCTLAPPLRSPKLPKALRQTFACVTGIRSPTAKA